MLNIWSFGTQSHAWAKNAWTQAGWTYGFDGNQENREMDHKEWELDFFFADLDALYFFLLSACWG